MSDGKSIETEVYSDHSSWSSDDPLITVWGHKPRGWTAKTQRTFIAARFCQISTAYLAHLVMQNWVVPYVLSPLVSRLRKAFRMQFIIAEWSLILILLWPFDHSLRTRKPIGQTAKTQITFIVANYYQIRNCSCWPSCWCRNGLFLLRSLSPDLSKLVNLKRPKFVFIGASPIVCEKWGLMWHHPWELMWHHAHES